MDTIIELLGFAALGHLVADFLANQFSRLPAKPFHCDMCMTFWISIVPYIALYGFRGILYASLSAIISNTLYKYTTL